MYNRIMHVNIATISMPIVFMPYLCPDDSRKYWYKCEFLIDRESQVPMA